jgi:hypothetical protein
MQLVRNLSRDNDFTPEGEEAEVAKRQVPEQEQCLRHWG